MEALDVPDWDVVGELYAELEIVEQVSPGSPRARDLEDAIDLLLDSRTGSRHPNFRRRDAVRRARFLREQAARKRLGAVARGSVPDQVAIVEPADDGHREANLIDRIDPLTPADVICARDTAHAIARAASKGPQGHHVARVLARLLIESTPATIASELSVSRSTVDRTIRSIRVHAREVLDAQEAA